MHTIDNCIALLFREQPQMMTKEGGTVCIFISITWVRIPIFYENYQDYELIAYGI